MTRRRRIVSAVVGVAVLAGMVALAELAFRTAFDTEYWRWYLANGAIVTLVFTLVTLAWGDLNRETHLISAHPVEYAVASMSLWILPGMASAATLQRGGRQVEAELDRQAAELRELAGAPAPPEEPAEKRPTGIPVVDTVLATLFGWAFLVAFVAWLLVIAPLQYFVYLVTGAPARAACASAARAWYRVSPQGLHVEEAWKRDPVPEGASESGFSTKPVSFTAAITTAALFATSALLG